MDQETAIQAPLSHPCYAGHFPGNPVVPGVLLLELVVAAVNRGAPRAIRSVKFHRALAPGATCRLRFSATGANVSFRCERDDGLVAEGALMFAEAG